MERAKAAQNLEDTSLRVYLLGTVNFEDLLRFQRRLHYEISGDRGQAALVLCEHPPLITVGRHGSLAHVLLESPELELRGWPLRWVNRAGGCWLHQPGQLSAYAIVPLDRFGRLGAIVQGWLADFRVHGAWRGGGAWVEGRLVAAVGCAVRDWVSYFGLCLNINPVLDPFRLVRCAPGSALPMTSLERERRGRVQPSMARQCFIEHFQKAFGFTRVSLFTSHLALAGGAERVAHT
jgi:lipoyl(octanoyl) transferase